MSTVQKFEDLLVWQKSRLLVKEVYKSLSACKDRGFIDQIQRACVSVMSNIAEGFERGTKEEFLNYLFIAKGSAGEVRAQLYAGLDIGYINIETFKYLKRIAEERSRLLSSFILKLKQGGLGGIQRKKEFAKDPIAEILEREGVVMTPKGIRKKSELSLEELGSLKDM